MSYCLHCGAHPGEAHLRICPDAANPCEYVIADPAPVTPPRRHLSPIASGTQDALERIAEIRAELDTPMDTPTGHPVDTPMDPPAEAAPVASIGVAEGDRSSGGSRAATGPPGASDDVGGCAHAV